MVGLIAVAAHRRRLPCTNGARLAIACCVMSAGLLNAPAAQAVIIYGGPTYDTGAGTGYTNSFFPLGSGRSAGNGVAVGSAKFYQSGVDMGYRAVRWDSSGATATVLSTLGTDNNGNSTSFAMSVNETGTTVGSAEKYVSGVDMGRRSVRWDASTNNITELGSLGTAGSGYTDSQAFDINSAGTVVGYAYKYQLGLNQGYRAVRWDASSNVAIELGNIGTDSSGYTSALANAINNSGTAVGWAIGYVLGVDAGSRPVRWNASGTATELGGLGAGYGGRVDGEAYSINSAGTSVGWAYKYQSTISLGSRAVRWSASTTAATELGNLGTDASGETFSQAFAMNSSGTAVGYARKYTAGIYKGDRATRWDASGTAATELANLGTDAGGVTNSEARAINDLGIAVGYADKYDLTGTLLGRRAVAWRANGAVLELDTLLEPGSGWVSLNSATGISNANWITGVGMFDTGNGLPPYERMFLMQLPVPEPTALSLLSFGGVILLTRRTRRQK